MSFSPDFGRLFTVEQDRKWLPLREAALKAIRSEFSLTGDPAHRSMEEFREIATSFQKQLHERVR